jgi:hypothetical protein
VEESRFEVDSFDSGTKRRQSTLALAPKECSYGDLVGYVPIVAEEVQNML